MRLPAIIHDRDGDIAGRVALGVGGQHLGGGLAGQAIRLEVHAAADRVGRVQPVGSVRLQPVGDIPLVGLLGDAVEEQVSQPRIG